MLGIWICGCSLFYRIELWASISKSANSTSSLKVRGCKRWCSKDQEKYLLQVCAIPISLYGYEVVFVSKTKVHLWLKQYFIVTIFSSVRKKCLCKNYEKQPFNYERFLDQFWQSRINRTNRIKIVSFQNHILQSKGRETSLKNIMYFRKDFITLSGLRGMKKAA